MNRNDLKRALCRLIPIRDNRVAFSSFGGRGYGDSPKAICETLHFMDPELDLCWLINGEAEAKSLPPYVRPIPNRGWKKLHTLASARVWVDNCRKWENVKGPGQYYLQTWHGFGPKQVEGDVEAVLDPAYVAAAKTDSAQCDLIVSGSRFMTDLYHRAFWYSGPVEETGTPRCDVFFTDLGPVREKVLKHYGLPGDRKLLLYAPTFRADKTRTDCYALDAEEIRRACEDRFGGDWTVMLRLHANAAAYSKHLFPYDGDRILDVTSSENPFSGSPRGHTVCHDIAHRVRLEISGKQLRIRVVAYRKEKSVHGDVKFRAVLPKEADTRDAESVTEHFLRIAVPQNLNLRIRKDLVLHSLRGAENVPPDNHINLGGQRRKIQGLLARSVSPAHYGDSPLPEEEAVTGSAGRHTGALVLLLRRKSKILRGSAGCDDKGISGDFLFRVDGNLHRPYGEIYTTCGPLTDIRTEAFRLLSHRVHKRVRIDSPGETGIVLDEGGCGKLSSGLNPFVENRAEPRPRSINRRCESGGTSAENKAPYMFHYPMNAIISPLRTFSPWADVTSRI